MIVYSKPGQVAMYRDNQVEIYDVIWGIPDKKLETKLEVIIHRKEIEKIKKIVNQTDEEYKMTA